MPNLKIRVTGICCFVDQNNGNKSANGLTSREREVIQLIAEGKINKQVAFMLDISVKTVETHRATIMRKMKFQSLSDLVRYAIRNHIISA